MRIFSRDENKYKEEDEYFIEESQEISHGSTGYGEKLLTLFPALESRNYRLYFSGQLVSMIGTWLQIVAEGWLVLKLTNSAFQVGLVTACATLPTLLFSLFGGVIVDRFPKKHILLVTQTLSMFLALTLGILTLLHVIKVWEIALIAFLLGTVGAIDSPARQSFVPEMVNKSQISSAIALSAGMFNAARVIGPAIAGFLIAYIGTGGAYILNALSYIAGIVGVYYMNVPLTVHRRNLHPLAAIKEGLSYSFSHPVIRTLLLFIGVTSIFGWSYSTIMPFIAQNTFHMDAAGLGYLYMAGGFGALVATFIVSAYGNKINPIMLILGGNTLFAVSIFLFSFTSSPIIGFILLFFGGIGLLSQFSTMNSTIQHMVTDEVRGRVMSIYTLMFIGLAPLGNFEVGFVSEKLGSGTAIRIGVTIVFFMGVVIYFLRDKIRGSYESYQEKSEK